MGGCRTLRLGSDGDRQRGPPLRRPTPDPRTWAGETLRRLHRRGRDRRRCRAGGGVRVPGTQWRREELHHADDRMCVPAERRDTAHPRHGPAPAGDCDPRAAGRLPATGLARPRAVRKGKSRHLCPVFRHSPPDRQGEGRRTARLRPAQRAGRQQGRAAVRRHEAPVDHRPGAGQRPGDRAVGRADHRAGPAGPAPGLGPAVPAQAAGRDAGADDSLHGRGRAVVRPARGDGRRQDRRRGLTGRADPPVRRPGGRRGALRHGRTRRVRGKDGRHR